jgi:3-hydroxy-9,10-secoandrosta-1,3,5(10)-triene-9,17-dione monooxygenase
MEGGMKTLELRDRLGPALPRIRQRSAQAEKARSIPAATIEDLKATGLFRSFVPAVFGGNESAIAPVYDALIELGSACTSTAWVASLFVMHPIMVRWLSERAQAEVWADDPDALIASSVAPVGTLTPCSGGFVLNGRWSFSSGVDHASWIVLLATVSGSSGSGKPDVRVCLLHASEITVEDDWYVSGLRATGSKSVRVRNVIVPEYRSEDMKAIETGRFRGRRSGVSPLARVPWRPFLNYTYSPAAIGTARAALEHYRERTLTRRHAYTGELFRTRATSWLRLARATAELDVAELVLRRDLEELERHAAVERSRRAAIEIRSEFGASRVVESWRRAIEIVYRGSGGGALYEKSPMQRYFRDLNAITQHAALDIDAAYERYGQALLACAPSAVARAPELSQAPTPMPVSIRRRARRAVVAPAGPPPRHAGART